MTGELAVPGDIRGFDCYTDSHYLEFMYRESSDGEALDASLRSWISTPSASLYAIRGDGWFIIANNSNKDLMADTLEGFGAFVIIPASPSDEPGTGEYDQLSCSQFAAAIIYGFVFDHAGYPQNLTEEAERILLEDYGDLEKEGKLDAFEAGSPEVKVELGNRSQRINEICGSGGDIFE